MVAHQPRFGISMATVSSPSRGSSGASGKSSAHATSESPSARMAASSADAASNAFWSTRGENRVLTVRPFTFHHLHISMPNAGRMAHAQPFQFPGDPGRRRFMVSRLASPLWHAHGAQHGLAAGVSAITGVHPRARGGTRANRNGSSEKTSRVLRCPAAVAKPVDIRPRLIERRQDASAPPPHRRPDSSLEPPAQPEAGHGRPAGSPSARVHAVEWRLYAWAARSTYRPPARPRTTERSDSTRPRSSRCLSRIPRR